MRTIVLIRHCQAEGQEAEAQLTESGMAQAKRLADFLAAMEIDYIVSSTYKRAFQSIKPLADQLGIPIVLDERLTERVLSGRNHPEWREMLLKTYEDLELCYEGGESGQTAMKRAAAVVTEVLESGHQNPAIVTHGNLLSLLLKHYDDRVGFKEWEVMSNPDVYRLTFKKDAVIMQRIWNA